MIEHYFGVEALLRAKICETHNQRAGIDFTEGKLALVCCCVDFEIECYKEIILLLTDYKSKPLSAVWINPDN